MSDRKTCKRLLISGRVQGVGFRANTRRKARQLDVRGWVRNRQDGSVETVICGPPSTVREMVNWCRQGPPIARVSDVTEEPYTPAEPLDGFSIRH